MEKKRCFICILSGIILTLTIQACAKPRIIVDCSKPKAIISPAMWGIFLEDINFGGDGGLYAELVKNRSFEFTDGMMGWSKITKKDARGVISIRDVNPFKEDNPHYLRIEAGNPGEGFGVTNEGFRGMGIRKGEKYWFSVYARSPIGTMSFKVEIVASDGRKIAEARFDGVTGDWQKYTCSIEAMDTDAKAKLNLLLTRKGLLDVDMVSLFPAESALSFEGYPVPGLRKDLVQMLAELKPGFFRFPGGCIVEGRDLDNRYQWKNTIGDINRRKTIICRWNNEFDHRYTPDYFQSFGLGFYEYFLLAEQIGAEPMPIINCGMACQFNTAQLVPMDELGPYVQDALDLIEFANGPATSKWGRKRADMGHPEPFEMKMLGIGNEQWGPQYIERYKVFVKAIKEKYPDITLIAATGSDPEIFPNGPAEVEYLQSELRKLNAEIIDEHFYRGPDWFLESSDHYDNYERNGPKVFVGEYAAQSVGVASPDNRNNLHSALAEAAFMTGLERNADLVVMSCYAPLFGNVNGWQWTPDLIWFDNLRVYGTPNYYVQQMFSLNRGDKVLTVQLNDLPAMEGPKKSLYVSSSLNEKEGYVIVKAVNITAETIKATVELQGIGQLGSKAKAIVLSSDKLTDENSLENPKKVYPAESSLPISGSSLSHGFKPYSLTVLRVPLK